MSPPVADVIGCVQCSQRKHPKARRQRLPKQHETAGARMGHEQQPGAAALALVGIERMMDRWKRSLLCTGGRLTMNELG
eukprot:scaffold2941_cov102-Isochrysis_galbana.AAC.5